MTGAVVQQKLKKAKMNCSLTRYSKAQEKYILSVVKRARRSDDVLFQHFTILVKAQQFGYEYEIDGAQKKFDGISELLVFCHQLDGMTRKHMSTINKRDPIICSKTTYWGPDVIA